MKLKIWICVLLVSFCVFGCETKHHEDDALLALLLIASQSGSGGGSGPIFLTYSLNNKFLGIDRSLPERLGKPNITGGKPNSFVVTPSLPAGLTIDSKTGIISGTPSNTSTVRINFTITASNTNSPGISPKVVSISIPEIFANSDGNVCVGDSINNAPGCDGSNPYSCGASESCYSSRSSCLSDPECTY
ncbi:Ig domain-containing protein [Leptospira interrogans]|uniref:Ig domain-containing protein n=1 Tax=Leptospira interrogans TaxID=173 RepID=UPI000297F35A|nr:Ig domain-containing protein [Leptospira interrogans]KAA1269114.1 Ig domain protein [Leptospira interrogans serovar Weerasinghe]EKR34863.1 Ig domain protein [Leptospira interrogans serovar Hebdomadis str. R499]QCO34410.1 Ig domain protein [Leptospira interrogans]QCO34430.1 Ig domain protein [Leptospira interrogans]QCO36263.1 Ig domain protein [Leptospira interrogans]